MGMGKIFKCENCGESFITMMGIGMNFPFEYQEIVNDIKNGKYGEEFKDLMLSREGVVVDLEKCLYICDKCGSAEQNFCFDFYVPKKQEDIEKVTKDSFYVTPSELKEDYELILKIEHTCDKCNSEMRKVEINETVTLECPECGSKMKEDGFVNWD